MAVKIYRAEQPDTESGVLWPEKRPIDWLTEKKRRFPTPIFQSQYNNDPSGLKGLRYDVAWLQYYTPSMMPPISTLHCVQTGDPATSELANADYFGHCTAGRDPATGYIYILGFAFGRIPQPKHHNFMKTNFDIWKDKGASVSRVAIEEVGPQQATSQALVATVRQQVDGMPIEIFKPRGSKVERFDTLTPYFENTILFPGERVGDILVMSRLTQFQEFLSQYTQFDKGARDDLLDALYMAVNLLTGMVVPASRSKNRDEKGTYTEEIDDDASPVVVDETNAYIAANGETVYPKGTGIYGADSYTHKPVTGTVRIDVNRQLKRRIYSMRN